MRARGHPKWKNAIPSSEKRAPGLRVSRFGQCSPSAHWFFAGPLAKIALSTIAWLMLNAILCECLAKFAQWARHEIDEKLLLHANLSTVSRNSLNEPMLGDRGVWMTWRWSGNDLEVTWMTWKTWKWPVGLLKSKHLQLVQNKGFQTNGLQYEPEGAKSTMESCSSMVSRNRCFETWKHP